MTEALALARARDQAGHVGDGEDVARGLHDAEVRHQRRERVVGDLRLGRAHRRDQRALARARVADQRDVRDRLEFEHVLAGLALLAEQREAGGLALGRGQRRVAQAAGAALGQHQLRARADQVGHQLAVPGLDHGAAGHGQHHVRAVRALPVRARARLAVARGAVRREVEVQQRGHVRLHDDQHISAAAAVAAVRAAERLELLPVHGGAAVAALARGDAEHHAVDEAGHRNLTPKRERCCWKNDKPGPTDPAHRRMCRGPPGEGRALSVRQSLRRRARC